jgi:hypothetical protein
LAVVLNPPSVVSPLDLEVSTMILDYLTPSPDVACRRLNLDKIPTGIKKAIMVGINAIHYSIAKYGE